MVSKELLKSELALRIASCEAKGDWRGREIYVSTWHRVNAEPELELSGLARRIAAKQAAKPLDERFTHTIPIRRVG